MSYLCTRKTVNGAIAQLVEQRTENPCVPGSIPGGTTFKRMHLGKSLEIQRFQGFFHFPYIAQNGHSGTNQSKRDVGFFWLEKKPTILDISPYLSPIYTVAFCSCFRSFETL